MKKQEKQSSGHYQDLMEIIKNKEQRIFSCKNNYWLFSLTYFARYHHFVMSDFHRLLYEDLKFKNLIGALWIIFRESAKRQPLTAKILTPTGFRLMGDLKIGDKVIGSDGKPTKIIFQSDIVNRPIFQIKTEDGRITECDSEHLWIVRRTCNTHGEKYKHKTVTTQYLIDSGLFYDHAIDKRNGKKYKEYKFAIETVKPVKLKTKKQIIDSYLLGLILGDGGIDKKTGFVRLHFHKDDDLFYRSQLKNYCLSDTKYDKRNFNAGRFSIKDIGQKIKELGLNVNVYNKFIPDCYLYGGINQRKAILEGLMDTDGTVSTGTASFCSVSEKLADGVVELVRSLGGRATKKLNNYNGKKSYRISILFTDYTPFRLERKKIKHRLSDNTFSRIVEIKEIGNKLGRCIKVDNKDGLYITDDYLVTHNTTLAKIKVIHDICYQQKKFIIWTSFDQKKAESNLFDIALELQTNKKIIADFGQLFYEEKLDNEKYSKKKSIGEFITANKVKVKAYSVGQSPRGEVYGEFRPDLAILDDVETLKTIVSEARTAQVISYIDELLSGLSGYANILVLGNKLTNNGSITYLENKIKNSENWKIRDIPIIKNGFIVWPDKFVYTNKEAEEYNINITEAEKKKISLQAKKELLGETVYNREMMNNPLSDENREIKIQWLQHYFEELKIQNKVFNRYIAIDTADSKARAKNDPDFTGTVVVDWDIENFWYIRFVKRERINAPELIKWIFYLWERYNPIKIGVEKKAFEDQIKPYLQIKSEETGIYPVVEQLEDKGTRKEDRIRGALQGRLEAKKILFKKDANDDTDILRQELFDFPQATHDDLADGLAYIQSLGHRPLARGKDNELSQVNREFFAEKLKNKANATDFLDGVI